MFFRNKKLSETEFANKFTKALQKKIKGLSILSINGLEIVTKFTDDEERRHFLDNAYIEYSNDIKSLVAVIDKYIRASVELYKPKEPIDHGNILPVIKDKRFLNGLEDLGPDVRARHVYEAYNSELYIFYANDLEHTIHYLTKDDLSKLGFSLEELREIAIRNLNRFEINKYGEEGYYMITAGGNYEASMILTDIWTKDNFDVNGDIIIGIPARDMLLITGSKDSANLHKLYDLIEDITKTGDHLVSDKLFELQGNRFEILN